TRLLADPLQASAKHAHRVNVEGTMNLLGACADPHSPVRKVVFKSSAHYYGCGPHDPAFFTEQMPRPRTPTTALERDVVHAEALVCEFAARHHERCVTIVRSAEHVGSEGLSAPLSLLNLPVVPSILGFDPRWQFIHE